MSTPLDMAAAAAALAAKLEQVGFDAATASTRQVLCLAEEAGEFVGAYRRWSGQARRSGSFEEMAAELADVVITAWVTAHVLGVDLDGAVREKLGRMYTRGWREGEPVVLDEDGDH